MQNPKDSLQPPGTEKFCIRIYWDALQKQVKGGGAGACATLQLQLLDLFWAKVLRLKDEEKLRTCMLKPPDLSYRSSKIERLLPYSLRVGL